VKTSSYMNSFLTLVNLGVMAVIVVAGYYYGNSDNWSSDGGFMPYGTTGIIAGAATCFYAYVGFDSIATSGEEAKDPAYSIPVATIIAMSVVCTGTYRRLIPIWYCRHSGMVHPDLFRWYRAPAHVLRTCTE